MPIPLPTFSPSHIHPILVNFTAALIPASVMSDVCGRVLRKSSLNAAAWWMLFYGAAVTPLTGLAGLWWKKQAGDTLPPELVFRHQWLGIGLAVLFVVLAVWRWRIYRESGVPRWGYLVLCLVSVAALVIQGSLGRAMLFGS